MNKSKMPHRLFVATFKTLLPEPFGLPIVDPGFRTIV